MASRRDGPEGLPRLHPGGPPLVEPGIAELAARKHSPQQLERLVSAYHAWRRRPSPPPWWQTDVEFHEALLACANNELLVPFAIIIEQALTHLFDYTTNKNPHYSGL